VLDEALKLTGQHPLAGAPAPLLAWLKEYEPENLEHTYKAISCKDWLKFKLTGEISTDPTEASTSFTDIRTQEYAPESFRIYALEEVQEKVPPVIGCMEVAGEITHEAATPTCLLTGTPVVSGLHDVDASALGVGGIYPGWLTMVAGTFSINEVVSTEPISDVRWACRNFVEPGKWMNMSLSPASATNLEWFVNTLCPLEIQQAKDLGKSSFAFVNEEVELVLEEDSSVFFHPFLYGSPHSNAASSAFLGLRGWHSRGHILKALFEGVVFNHKTHVDWLLSSFDVSEARLAGGGAKSELWSQMFADALDLPIGITEVEETGALGAAICAGRGANVYDSLEDAIRRTVQVIRTHEPNPKRHAQLSEAYAVYKESIDALEPTWPRLG